MGQTFPDGQLPRVLVIDDDAGIRLVVRMYLQQHGFEVVVADNGLDGLAWAQAQPPDAIVLDLMMPVVDGFQVLAQLREDRRTKDVPVVVLTALPAAAVHERVRILGADEVVTKPFHGDDLVAAIHEHVGGLRIAAPDPGGPAHRGAGVVASAAPTHEGGEPSGP